MILQEIRKALVKKMQTQKFIQWKWTFYCFVLLLQVKHFSDNLLICDEIEFNRARAIFYIILNKIKIEPLSLENEHNLMKSYFLKW